MSRRYGHHDSSLKLLERKTQIRAAARQPRSRSVGENAKVCCYRHRPPTYFRSRRGAHASRGGIPRLLPDDDGAGHPAGLARIISSSLTGKKNPYRLQRRKARLFRSPRRRCAQPHGDGNDACPCLRRSVACHSKRRRMRSGSQQVRRTNWTFASRPRSSDFSSLPI